MDLRLRATHQTVDQRERRERYVPQRDAPQKMIPRSDAIYRV
jgi:hypothetical protein